MQNYKKYQDYRERLKRFVYVSPDFNEAGAHSKTIRKQQVKIRTLTIDLGRSDE